MRMLTRYLLPLCFLVCVPCMLQATPISFSPSAQNATLGNSFAVDLTIKTNPR